MTSCSSGEMGMSSSSAAVDMAYSIVRAAQPTQKTAAVSHNATARRAPGRRVAMELGVCYMNVL